MRWNKSRQSQKWIKEICSALLSALVLVPTFSALVCVFENITKIFIATKRIDSLCRAAKPTLSIPFQTKKNLFNLNGNWTQSQCTRNGATEIERVYFLFTMDFTSVWVDSSQKSKREKIEKQSKNLWASNAPAFISSVFVSSDSSVVESLDSSVECISAWMFIVQVHYGVHSMDNIWQQFNCIRLWQERIQCRRSGALVAVYFTFGAFSLFVRNLARALWFPPPTHFIIRYQSQAGHAISTESLCNSDEIDIEWPTLEILNRSCIGWKLTNWETQYTAPQRAGHGTLVQVTNEIDPICANAFCFFSCLSSRTHIKSKLTTKSCWHIGVQSDSHFRIASPPFLLRSNAIKKKIMKFIAMTVMWRCACGWSALDSKSMWTC